MTQDYEKMKIYLRSWLIGRGYYKAVKAMNFAENLHNGTRKGGSPEFSHQVSQACYAITMVDSFIHPEETIITILLHDTIEDVGATYKQLLDLFGVIVADATLKISKVVNGVRIPDDIYYKGMYGCPIVTIAKPIDRVHNLMTMWGGFKPEKQVSYVEETELKVVPLLKSGRKDFPSQQAVYENIKFVMTNQVQLYKIINKNLMIK